MVKNIGTKILYFCVGCRQIHWDNDYCKVDGDLQILNWDKFLKSIKKVEEDYLLFNGKVKE